MWLGRELKVVAIERLSELYRIRDEASSFY